MSTLLSLQDVEGRMKLVMQFFGNDTSRLCIHLSNYLHKNIKTYRPHILDKKEKEGSSASKQGEAKKDIKKVTTNMDKSITSSASPLSDELTSLIEKDSSVDLITFLKEKGHLNEDKLLAAQRIRRSSVLGTLSTKVSSDEGRKMSAIQKKECVVDAALKLADAEEEEDNQFEEEWEQEEFMAGDEVIIVEGENGGLFGTLQHATGGIFGAFDPAVREDAEGNYGVDVHAENGKDEGYWIHPEAMQHKKYIANQEVKVIDGINIGRFGTIQSDGKRIRMDDGSYGVDVKMEDGSIEGYWIHPTSMVPAEEVQKEKKDEDLEDWEQLDKFEFLPYVSFPGDALDEALGHELNTHEIDINIRRLVTKTGKVVYRFGGKRHLVRYIHGVLLVKENKVWNELMPVLQKLAEKKD